MRRVSFDGNRPRPFLGLQMETGVRGRTVGGRQSGLVTVRSCCFEFASFQLPDTCSCATFSVVCVCAARSVSPLVNNDATETEVVNS